MSECGYPELIGRVAERYEKAGRPMALQLELTKRCVLDCVHCYVDHPSAPQELGTAEVMSLLDQARDMGVLIFTLTGGEPLLRPDALDILEAAVSRHFLTRLFTSGTTLDPALISRLGDIGVGDVHVSLYSHDPEVHDRITTRKGSHSKSLKAIQDLVRAGFGVTVKIAVLRPNRRDLRRTVELARSLGADFRIDFNILPSENGVRDTAGWRLSQKQQIELLTDPDNAEFFTPPPEAESHVAAMASETPQGPLCGLARQVMVVDAEGGLHPCSVYPAVANIREGRLDELWYRHPTMLRLKSLSWRELGLCPTCAHRATCTPCPAEALLEHGDPFGCSLIQKERAIALKALLDKT